MLDHRSLPHIYKSCIVKVRHDHLNEEQETALQALRVAVGSKTDKLTPQPLFLGKKRKGGSLAELSRAKRASRAPWVRK